MMMPNGMTGPTLPQNLPEAYAAVAAAAAVHSNASHMAMLSRRASVSHPNSVIRYCHRVEVLASTRSPALNTGPLPANRLRTVRRTIRPSSDIQRRVQPPQNAATPATTAAASAEMRAFLVIAQMLLRFVLPT